jgi:hypothetical protein
MTLYQSLDTFDDEEIIMIVTSYEKNIHVLCTRCSHMSRKDRIHWAVPSALSPERYGPDNLVACMQNTMLVSALLLTVTASLFLSPYYDLSERDFALHRVFTYMSGLSSLLFLLSILFGISFIENAICRPYSAIDKYHGICSSSSITQFKIPKKQ